MEMSPPCTVTCWRGAPRGSPRTGGTARWGRRWTGRSGPSPRSSSQPRKVKAESPSARGRATTWCAQLSSLVAGLHTPTLRLRARPPAEGRSIPVPTGGCRVSGVATVESYTCCRRSEQRKREERQEGGHHKLDLGRAARRVAGEAEHARRRPWGIIVTILIGIAGDFVGGFVFSRFGGTPARRSCRLPRRR